MINIFLAIFLSFFIVVKTINAEIVVIDLSSRHNDEKEDQSNNEETDNDLELFVEDSNLTSEENSSEDKIESELNEVENNNDLNNLSDVWKESSSKNIIFLLEKLTNQVSSEVINFNLTNFLIYGNLPPKDMEQADFDKLRIMTLKKLDNVNAAIQVMNNISTYEDNKDYYDLIFLEKGLIDYNLSSVCSSINSDSNFNTNTFLLKIMTLCSFLDGKKEEANFFNSLILEDSEDELFQALYNKLIGIETELKNIQEYNYDKESISIYSAIMRTMDLKFSEDFVNLNSPELLKAIAISPSTDISIRIDAAQKAFKTGSLGSNSIAAIYQSVDFSAERFDFSALSPYYDEVTQENKIRVAGFTQGKNLFEIGGRPAPIYELPRAYEPKDDARFAIEFSVMQALNEDIMKIFATLDSMDNILGAPELMFAEEYPGLADLRKVYFNRLTDTVNYKNFFDFFRWLDDSFDVMIENLIPRKTNYLGFNFVLESHALERAKIAYGSGDVYLGESARRNLKGIILLRQLIAEVRKI